MRGNRFVKVPVHLSQQVEDWLSEQAYERHRFAGSIADSVRQARRAAGFTQAELAVVIGSTQASISRLERGRLHDVGTQMLQRIGSALELETHVVFQRRRPD